MNGILSLLKSRKAWITIFGIIASVFGTDFGLNPNQVTVIAGLCAVLVFSIAGEDASKMIKVNLPNEKDKAKE